MLTRTVTVSAFSDSLVLVDCVYVLLCTGACHVSLIEKSLCVDLID